MTDHELLQEIHDRFPPRALDPDQAFDPQGGSYLNIDEFRHNSQKYTWEELNLKFLRFHYDSLQQLSPLGFVDYVPAFLAIMIRDRPHVDIIPLAVLAAVTPSPIPSIAARYKERIHALNDGQKTTILNVIAHLKAAETDEVDRERMDKAVQEIHAHIKERAT